MNALDHSRLDDKPRQSVYFDSSCDPCCDTGHPSLTAVQPELWYQSLRRGHFALFALVTVVLSFAYGLASGLDKNVTSAHASRVGYGSLYTEGVPEKIHVPSGSKAIRVGTDINVNGSPAEMVHVVSERGVQVLLTEVVHRWEAQKIRALGLAAPQRGMAVGLHPVTGERYSATFYAVPPQLRATTSNGYPTQGYLSYIDAAKAAPADSNLLSDIVLPQGTTPGGSVSSRDPGGRSTSAFYTLPFAMEEAHEWLRSALNNSGWRFKTSGPDVGYMVFGRGGKERTAMLTPVANTQSAAPERTLLFLVERSQLMEGEE